MWWRAPEERPLQAALRKQSKKLKEPDDNILPHRKWSYWVPDQGGRRVGEEREGGVEWSENENQLSW